jgi:hypothetical protein
MAKVSGATAQEAQEAQEVQEVKALTSAELEAINAELEALTGGPTAAAIASGPGKVVKVKRFVIKQASIGKNEIMEFVNKKGVTCTYNHDVVFNQLKAKFEAMPCFQKYKSYTNSNDLPKFVRDLPTLL